MKEATLYKDGAKVDFTITGATNVGDVVPLGTSMIGIASTSGLTGEEIALDVKGIYEINAATADTVAVGDVVYFDHVNRVITTATDDGVGTNYARAGVAVSAKAGAVAGIVLVRIDS
jgi:predicted RecA/RadA family phage recombinase